MQSISNCVDMAEAVSTQSTTTTARTDRQVPKCHKMYTKHCIESHDYTACALALGYCGETLGQSFIAAGRNP